VVVSTLASAARTLLHQRSFLITASATLAIGIGAASGDVSQRWHFAGAPQRKHCVHAPCTGAPPGRRLDSRITQVLGSIRGSDELRLSIDDAAAATVFRTFHQMFGIAPSLSM